MSSTLALCSVDGKFVRLSESVARVSPRLSTLLDSRPKLANAIQINLDAATKPVLEKIVQWCTHQMEQKDAEAAPKQSGGRQRATSSTTWDDQFLASLSMSLAISMLTTADYLELQPLVLALAAKVAAEQKTSDATIRLLFGVGHQTPIAVPVEPVDKNDDIVLVYANHDWCSDEMQQKLTANR